MASIPSEPPFSLTHGGPFFRVLMRCHLIDPRGHLRWIWFVVIGWVPIVVASLAQLAVLGHEDAILRDPTMHVRLLVTVPLLGLAEHLLEVRCTEALRYMREEGVVERESINAILDRTARLRDSRIVEVVIALLVLLLGQAALWGAGDWGGFVHGPEGRGSLSFATVWCLAIALPLVQFMVVRWVWHWMLWSYVVARLARLRLSLNALHPDKAAGLELMSDPIEAFGLFNAAVASMASAAWIAQVVDGRETVQTVTPLFFTVFAIATVVACGPLLLFAPQLYRARHRDGDEYHALAREYVDEFRRKWTADKAGGVVLGTRDIQSLADLGNALERTEATRIYPFGMRTLIVLWAGALVPMLPLIVMTTPMSDVASHLGRMMFGLGG